MKKLKFMLLLVLVFVLVPTVASANSNTQPFKSSYLFPNFTVVNNNTYHINETLLDTPNGLYKTGSNVSNYRLLAKGSFRNLQAYKNTLFVHDMENDYVAQYDVNGKLLKTLDNINSDRYQIYNNHIYYYDYYTSKIYRTNMDGTNRKLVVSTGNGYVDEFTIHNGYLYYINQFQYNGGNKIEEFIYKVKLSQPNKPVKLTKPYYNLDSLVVQHGHIYIIAHKTKNDVLKGRHLYRMTYNGKQIQQLSSQKIDVGYAVGKNHIYFVQDTVGFNKDLYRMKTNGTQVKLYKKLFGAPASISSHRFQLFFVTNKGSKFVLQRIPIK